MNPVQQSQPTTPARRAPRRAAEAPTGPAPAPRGRPAMVEADVRLRLDDQARADANGTVRLERDFVLRLVRHLLRRPERFRELVVRFDPATGSWAATGKVCLKGVWLPVAARARATVDGGRPAIAFDEVRLRFGPDLRWSIAPGWLKSMVATTVAEEITNSHVTAEADRERAVVRMDVNDLLYKIDALPRWVSLDAEDTRLAIRTSAQGDIFVDMRADAQGPALRSTPYSDISIAADAEALQATLFRALAPGYVVRRVHVRDRALSLEGEVDYKPLSDAVTGLRALAALLSGGRAGSLHAVKVMGSLDLEVAMEGTKLTIKPSLKRALPEIVKALEAAGVAHEPGEREVRVDLAPWLAQRGIRVQDARTNGGELEARLEVDIDSRIRNPALRPSAADSARV